LKSKSKFSSDPDAAHELVGDERREEVQRREPAGLGLQDAHLEVLGHAGEAQLA
jgi:hypothetical protein